MATTSTSKGQGKSKTEATVVERLMEAREAMKSKLHYKCAQLVSYLLFLLSAVKEISDLLNTGLDDETLRVCVQLLEAGVNPEALATVVQELRRETGRIRVSW